MIYNKANVFYFNMDFLFSPNILYKENEINRITTFLYFYFV